MNNQFSDTEIWGTISEKAVGYITYNVHNMFMKNKKAAIVLLLRQYTLRKYIF